MIWLFLKGAIEDELTFPEYPVSMGASGALVKQDDYWVFKRCDRGLIDIPRIPCFNDF
jgi:hypothetical protein